MDPTLAGLWAVVRAVSAGIPALLNARTKQKLRAALYFEALAAAILDVSGSLRAAQGAAGIPHAAGHRLEMLLRFFPEVVKSVYLAPTGKEKAALKESYRQLEDVAEQARKLDWHLITGDPEIGQSKYQWLDQMDRVGGELQAFAVQLRVL